MGQRTMKFLWDKLAQWKVCGWLVPGAVMGLVGEVENKGQHFPIPLPLCFHSPTRDRTDQEEMDSSISGRIIFPVGFQESRGGSQ